MSSFFFGGFLQLQMFSFRLRLMLSFCMRLPLSFLLLNGKHHQFPNRFADPQGHISPRFVAVRPASNWFCVFGERLKFAKWRSAPINRSNDDWDHANLPFIMPLQRPLHLPVVTII